MIIAVCVYLPSELADSSLSYPQFITWAELYQPKPPSKCRSSREQQPQQQLQLLLSRRM